MTEEDLDAAVVQLCDELGLITLHVREPGREGGEWAGFPDRVIYGPNRPYVLYRELKTRRFSVLISCQFDPADRKKILSTARLTPLYRHDGP